MSPRIPIRLLGAQSDQRLAALVGAGHERAFEALVHRYRGAMLRYCRRMDLSDARAEDVVQQAFLQAWQSLARGTDVRELKPWLYRIVHNAAVNSMRSASVVAGPIADVGAAGIAAASSADLDGRIVVREVLSEVAALPELQRRAILQTTLGGQSHDEVASAMGLSEGAVRGLVYRARATLRGAAAALTPQPLIAWACGGGGPAAPTGERVAELAIGGGAVGVTSVLLKGAVVAVTAAVVAGGADVVEHHAGHGHGHAIVAGTSALASAPQLARPAHRSAHRRHEGGEDAHRGTSRAASPTRGTRDDGASAPNVQVSGRSPGGSSSGSLSKPSGRDGSGRGEASGDTQAVDDSQAGGGVPGSGDVPKAARGSGSDDGGSRSGRAADGSSTPESHGSGSGDQGAGRASGPEGADAEAPGDGSSGGGTDRGRKAPDTTASPVALRLSSK